jgi:two-component system sensor histidine kinase AlgZ
LLHGNGGDGPIGDVASINQTGAGIRLPNFCNLGIMLRSLIIVNLLLLPAALLRAAQPGTVLQEFLLLAAFSEPALIVSLVGLCAARRWLHAIGYARSIAMLVAFELLLAALLWKVAGDVFPDKRAMPFAHLAVLTLFVTGFTIA